MRFTRVKALVVATAVVALAAMASPPPPAQAIGTPTFSSGAIFTAATDGYDSYVIPGIMAVSDSIYLAWTDARYAHDDGSPSDAVLKRSTDGGATWGPIVVMGSGVVGGTPTLNVGQPTIARDSVSGRLSYFYTTRGTLANPADPTHCVIYVRTSTDDGVTWGAPSLVSNVLVAADAAMQTAITNGTAPSQFAGETAANYGRDFFVPGPGLPIQLSSHYAGAPNRLLVPIFALKNRGGTLANRGYGDMMLASDDGGVTWYAGGIVPQGAYSSNEVSIVELANNRVYLNARTAVTPTDNQRSFSRSASGGSNWLAPALVSTSVIPAFYHTHAGLARLSDPLTDPTGTSRILFSYPNDPAARDKLTVAISYDEGASFSVSKVIVPGTAAYSNMAITPSQKILLAYATGGTVTLAQFNLDYLSDGTDTFSGGRSVVVDNGGAGYSEVGTWASATSATGYFGADYRYDGSSAADPGSSATFTPTIPATGNYRVYMRWAGTGSRPDAAPVTITYNGGSSTATLTVNEQVNAGQWNAIGDYAMTAGTGNKVTLSAADAGFTIADAVMFERLP